MAKKGRPSGEVVILSAAAVMAIYAAGYLLTEPAAGLTADVLASPTPAASIDTLRDGTYLGHGESRFGSVYVTVEVAGARITHVWINATTTTFPSQVIESLPGAVVERQTASVDLVSGATGSSYAFIQAVTAALREAQR
jgi:fumarate reductase flavoprotein subunit